MQNFCNYYNEGTCRSCDLIESDYPEQIKFKEQLLESSLVEIKHPTFFPTIRSNPTNFRNKAKFVVTGTITAPIIGLSGTENLDQGRELLNCPLHLPLINELLPSLKEFITQIKLPPYSIAEKTGELKGIIIFVSDVTNEAYLRFVLRSKESIDRIKKHSPDLIKKHPALKCISANIQPIAHAILEGEEEIILTTESTITHRYKHIGLTIDPRAFVQTNQAVAKSLYETAASWVKESQVNKFVELFSGLGAFTFHSAKFFQSGLGIEINSAAVARANQTAKEMDFRNVNFLASDAGKVLRTIQELKPDLILVNPPRRGLSESLEILKLVKPTTIIYSSCNYQTLASDLKKLSDLYKIDQIQIFDMFPHTKHFETLVKLTLHLSK